MKANNNQKFKFNIKIKSQCGTLYLSSHLYVSHHLLLHLMWNFKSQLTRYIYFLSVRLYAFVIY